MLDVGNSFKMEQLQKFRCNFISEDKKMRKQALIDLESFLSLHKEMENDELRRIFNEIHIYVINTLRDKAEAVREQGITFLRFLYIDKLPLSDYYLTYLIPILVERLGNVEIVEESEEIRLQLVKFLHDIIIKYSQTTQLRPFLNDAVLILRETVKDKFPNLKEESCKCIVDLAKALPLDIHMAAEVLINPVLTAFTHQRYKIRVQAIKCIGEVILHCSYKGLEDVLTPMAERLFDLIPLVRQTVAEVAGLWLLVYKDRYSFFSKLLPLLLTGLNDEVAETRQISCSIWSKVGLQYMKENEKELKDQMDFLIQLPEFYPKNWVRPSLGCRVLVQRNVMKICKALSNELGNSWQGDVKIRCGELLCSIALHAEEGITQNLQEILPAMYSTARNDNKNVVVNILRASEIMGLFVPPETWIKLIIPAIENGPHHGHFVVLGGFIKGAPQILLSPHLKQITNVLQDNIICQSRKDKYQKELTQCVKNILEKTTKENRNSSSDLFTTVLTLVALKNIEDDLINDRLFDELSESLGYESIYELWHVNLPEILNKIDRDPKTWTINTAEKCIFDTILLKSREAFGENLEKICQLLIDCLKMEGDPEARLKTFVCLSAAFDNKVIIFNKTENFESFIIQIMEGVLIPYLTWHAGQTSEAMRTVAATCLLSCLTPIGNFRLFNSSDSFKKTYNMLFPLLITLMEDRSHGSRKLALDNFRLLKITAVELNCWEIEDFVILYLEIIKRFDDPSEEVRLTTLQMFPTLLSDIPREINQDCHKCHSEHICNTLLNHFDDKSQEVRNYVFESFKLMALHYGNSLKEKVETHKTLFRNHKGLEELIDYINKNEIICT